MSQAEPLRVVVTNDDGIDSEGLRLLAAGYASVTPLQPVYETPAPWLPWPATSGAEILAHP